MPYVIGLTGNIATGKSLVARMLGRLGAAVIDADRLAHATMAPNGPAHEAVLAHFGRRILADDGTIDRRKLGAIVFADPSALADLERLVHPPVVAETLRLLAACKAPVAVIEAIKLLEAGMDAYCQAVWVVTCDRRQQWERLVRERGLSPVAAEQRIAAQPAPEAKVARADVIVDNSGGLEDTFRQVRSAWNAIPGVAPVPETIRWADLARDEVS